MNRIESLAEIYVFYSACTNMAYIYQHPETYEDLLLVFSDKENAQAQAEGFRADKRPVQLITYKKEQYEAFFTGIHYIGADGVLLDWGKEETIYALPDLVETPDFAKLPNRVFAVNNPSLQISLLYFLQEARRPIPFEEKQGLREMEEEVRANLFKATYLVPHRGNAENGGKGQKRFEMMAIKDKKGDAYQPLFTDAIELTKMMRGRQTACLIMPFKEIAKLKGPQLAGYVINPMGQNLILKREQMETLMKLADK